MKNNKPITAMKHLKFILASLVLATGTAAFVSCSDDSGPSHRNAANATVTLKTDTASGLFYMQLDDSTTVLPTNIKVSPVGKREVRALANLKFTKERPQDFSRAAVVNWIDTIRTKTMSPDMGTKNDSVYGNDPVEIVNHWTTSVEDGYLTVRFRTYFRPGSVHRLSLLKTGKPYEVVLMHDAAGDKSGYVRDGIIAFNLSQLPDTKGKTETLTVKWKSYGGEKTAKFNYRSRN